MSTTRQCVFTTLFGGYEEINAQPVSKLSTMDFICLTDNPDLKSNDWEVRVVQPEFINDPIRSQRLVKINPQRYFPEYDLSLYIDNTVELQQVPELLVDKFNVEDKVFVVPSHSFRNNLQEEFVEVVKWGLDDYARVWEQNNHYLQESPEIMSEQIFWTGLMIRHHNEPEAIKIAQMWSDHVLRYSRRDQLSLPYVLHLCARDFSVIDLDNHESSFHIWPIHNKRNTYIRKDSNNLAAAPAAATSAMVGSLAFERDQLRIDNQDLTGERDQLRIDNQDLTGERDQLRIDNQDLTGERDQLRIDNQDLTNYIKTTFAYKILSRIRKKNGKLSKIVNLLS